MNKIVAFMRAAPASARETFQNDILTMANAGLDEIIGAVALHVNLVLLPPPNLPYRPPSDPGVGKPPEYDVIVEAWSTAEASAVAQRLHKAMIGKTSVIHAYAVTHKQIYNRKAFSRGRPSAGIKLMGRLMFHADLPDTAAMRSWGLHAPLAARVHVGSAIYVQNWVLGALSADCPPARGIPIMHFPTDVDFFDGFVDSPRGMQEILQDTSHFVASGPRFYTTEHIIRAANT